MVAFQAVDPGSIPGRRSLLFLDENTNRPYGNCFISKLIFSKIRAHSFIKGKTQPF